MSGVSIQGAFWLVRLFAGILGLGSAGGA
jgi:hypothetical protein